MLIELIQTLQKAQSCIKEYDQIKVELQAVVEQRDKLKDKVKELEGIEDACDSLTDENTELKDKLSGYASVNLGLDTLHYKLERGNLLIQQRLESFIRSANTIPHAEAMFI